MRSTHSLGTDTEDARCPSPQSPSAPRYKSLWPPLLFSSSPSAAVATLFFHPQSLCLATSLRHLAPSSRGALLNARGRAESHRAGHHASSAFFLARGHARADAMAVPAPRQRSQVTPPPRRRATPHHHDVLLRDYHEPLHRSPRRPPRLASSRCLHCRTTIEATTLSPMPSKLLLTLSFTEPRTSASRFAGTSPSQTAPHLLLLHSRPQPSSSGAASTSPSSDALLLSKKDTTTAFTVPHQ